MTTRLSPPSSDDIHSLKAFLLEKDKRISLLEEQVRLLRHKRFAASSEKSDGQTELFNEAEAAEPVPEEDLNENTDDAETETIQYERRKSRGRKSLPADLPHVRIEHDLADADKVCECGCALTHIGEDTSEQLDIIPATVQVLVHARLKYACKACELTVRTAALPAQPIPKSNASAGLLAYIATAEYQDALPLHRQEAIFKRMEIDIPRNTLANWMMRSGELIAPLITQLDHELRRGKIIQCDETPLQVLNEPDRPASSQSYMGVRRSGAPDHPIVLYDYAPSRAGSVAENLLKGFSGYLQTDDYAGYHAVGRQDGISHVGCWAHARRKFVDAQKAATSKDKKTARTGKADVAINYIAKLYAIEKQAKDASSKARRQLRQDKSVPILNALREWLDKTLHSTLPKGLLGTALGYLNKNWEKLIRYIEDGDVNIDNNLAEDARSTGARQAAACEVVGISAKTYQRWDRRDNVGDSRQNAVHTPAKKLSALERQRIIKLVNEPEYADLAPSQIVPTLADEGRYNGSESTLYRILKDEKQLNHRQKSRLAAAIKKPKAPTATGANQIYTWDITYPPTRARGVFLYLYVVMDIYSRKIVGWQVHDEERSVLAVELMTDICQREGVKRHQVTLHSDNGSPMKGATMLATLQQLGIMSSFSLPSVSNDNPYSESLFRTLKYRPSYPAQPFTYLHAARV